MYPYIDIYIYRYTYFRIICGLEVDFHWSERVNY